MKVTTPHTDKGREWYGEPWDGQHPICQEPDAERREQMRKARDEALLPSPSERGRISSATRGRNRSANTANLTQIKLSDSLRPDLCL